MLLQHWQEGKKCKLQKTRKFGYLKTEDAKKEVI